MCILCQKYWLLSIYRVTTKKLDPKKCEYVLQSTYRVPPKKRTPGDIAMYYFIQNELGKFRLHSLVAPFLNIKYGKNKACILKNKVVMAVSMKHV